MIYETTMMMDKVEEIDLNPEKIKTHELYDITKHYKSKSFIRSNIIPDIKNEINNYYNNVLNNFNKSVIIEYNRIYKICNRQFHIDSYLDLYDIINDVIMRGNEDFNEYFYISSNMYDLLNYSLIKCCEEYFIDLIKDMNFSLELLACQDELKFLLGKYYFYSNIYNTLINGILSNKLTNFVEMTNVINDEIKFVNITDLIVNFLPSCAYDKKNINYDSDYDSDSLSNNEYDNDIYDE